MRAAFGVREAEPEPLDAVGGPSWRCGEVVLRPVSAPTEAAWMAQTMDGLQVDGVRLARPVRSTDGRWVVAGWAGARHLTGRTEPRYDEVVAASLRLHAATAALPRPPFLDDRQDVYALADRAAFGEQQVPLPAERGGRLFGEFVGARRPVPLAEQVVHGDLFGNVLFAGSAPPGVIDLAVHWRPAEWAAAVVVVDALAWGGADDGLADRWAHLQQWPQVLLRALLYRVAVNALHPQATEQSLAGLQRAAAIVSAQLTQAARAGE